MFERARVGIVVTVAACVAGCDAPGADERAAATTVAAAASDATSTAARDIGLTRDEAWDELVALQRDAAAREGLPARYTPGGLLRSLVGGGFRVPAAALGVASAAEPRAVADAFVRRYAALWGVPAGAFENAAVRTRHHASELGADVDKIVYAQRHDGVPVVGAEVVVLVESDTRDVIGVRGSFVPIDDSLAPAVVTAEEATLAGGALETTRAVIWSGLLDGTASPPRRAWAVATVDEHGGRQDVYVDAVDRRQLGATMTTAHSLRRALVDSRGAAGYSMHTCQKWSDLTAAYPAVLAGCTRPACTACASDEQQCARCVCRDPLLDPAGCETFLWQYDDLSTAGACVGNGDPVGEPAGACDPQAASLWNDAAGAYNYWQSTFGRDGWDGAGSWLLLRARVGDMPSAGTAQPRYVGASALGDYPFVQVNIEDGAAGPHLHGHELGHALQYGTFHYNGLTGFYDQTVDVQENHADMHAFAYRGLRPAGDGHDCSRFDNQHYNQYRAIPDLQTNRMIGNCHSWLLSRAGPAYTYHGVSVTPVPLAHYDQVWFRALDVYLAGGDDYFDWWNHQITAAADLYGVGSATHQSFVAARDAIGGWTENRSLLTTAPGGGGMVLHSLADRIAAVGQTASPARAPCIFWRRDATTIHWSCKEAAGWRPAAAFNSAADPAASEPAAAFRYESGKLMIYVLWRGNDSRIHYRTLDTSTYAISGPLDMGPNRLTSGAVAAAPIYESAALDRLVVVYHPLANPTYFFSTHIGDTGAPIDLGPALDSAVAPALAPFPYYGRIYFARPDSSGTGDIRYSSYTLNTSTLVGTWEPMRSISDLYVGAPELPANVVSSDYPVALAQFQRGATPRLRLMFTTTTGTPGGRRELWYAGFREVSPGVLLPELLPLERPVPLTAVTAWDMQSPGGLTADFAGTSLWNFWGSTKVAGWQTFAD